MTARSKTAVPTSSYLPAGPARPDPARLEAFWRAACAGRSDLGTAGDYEVRWIGLDDETTEQVLELIASGDKTGTFTLPWIVERTGQPQPQAGRCIVLIDYRGAPRLLVRLTRVEQVAFGDVTERDTAIDGSPVRALATWKPLHTRYWNDLLRPFGLRVSDDMPVLVEAFELCYEAGQAATGTGARPR